MDIITMFLYSEIDAIIFIKQPPRFVKLSKVCLLKKALYRLK